MKQKIIFYSQKYEMCYVHTLINQFCQPLYNKTAENTFGCQNSYLHNFMILMHKY